MILGISGLSGSGKDTTADLLVKNHGFVKVSLADPLKRICRDVFNFTDEQLWGPSEKRNEIDERYNRGTITLRSREEGVPDEVYPQYLSPRYALQQLGTEWGRNCYDNVWIDYALRVAKSMGTPPQKSLRLIDETEVMTGFYYSARYGLKSVEDPISSKGIVIPDVRFKNEMTAIREAGGKVIRIKRPDKETPEWNHASETEQLSVPDEWFDHVLINEGDLADLGSRVLSMMNKLKGGKNES